MMPGDGFTILMVCSGNICRSPLAEQLVRVGLSQIPGVSLGSAGTIARPGDLMTSQAQALSVRFGGDPGAHQAQRVDASMVGSADLILGMAREHRREVVSMVPRSVRRAFTIREFARLAQAISLPELHALSSNATDSVFDRQRRAVELVASFRGQVDPPDDPADDDVIDPYRESDAVYERSAAQLVPAAAAVVRVLATAGLVR